MALAGQPGVVDMEGVEQLAGGDGWHAGVRHLGTHLHVQHPGAGAGTGAAREKQEKEQEEDDKAGP